MDVSSRHSVLELWHSVYQASEGYHSRVGWTGNFNGNNGNTSAEFVKDVERRTNYFRAMCGLPSTARFNTGTKVVIRPDDLFKPDSATSKAAAAQSSALMLVRNYNPATGSVPAISHNPAPHLVGWTPAAWNANAKGNIAFGLFGPGAVDAYFQEEMSNGSAVSPWNYQVGHRRWLLQPAATDFATGDQPGDGGSKPASNIIYVMQSSSEPAPAPPGTGGTGGEGTFVAYPPAGFFPGQLNSRYWSLSRAGADFSSASVKVTNAQGKEIPLLGIHQDSLYAGPALVWQVADSAANRNISTDARFQVHVSGIKGQEIPTSYSYQVTLINPLKLTDKQTLKGPSVVAAGKSARFTLPASEEQTRTRITVARKLPATWVENGEKPKSAKISQAPSPVYPLIAQLNDYSLANLLSGSRAFHLAFPTVYDPAIRGIPEQIFEIERPLLPKAKSKLSFKYVRGFMTPSSHLVVEYSKDGGVTWLKTGPAITGKSGDSIQPATSIATMRLPKSSKPVRLRFRLFSEPESSVFVHRPNIPTGIFIDDISVRNCDWLMPLKSTTLPPGTTHFVLNRATAGGQLRKNSHLALSMARQIGGHWFPDGPLKTVKVR